MLKAKKKADKSGVDREWSVLKCIPNLLLMGPSIYSLVAGLDRVGATHRGCTDSP
jgi:hypothetical protein